MLQFSGLQNTVPEGGQLTFRPHLPYNGQLQQSDRYFVGPSWDWLQWNAEKQEFHGKVPSSFASEIGAEKNEAYTTALQIIGIISRAFNGDVRFERTFRCALPITVKRAAISCIMPSDSVKTPKNPRSSLSRPISWPNLGLTPRGPLRRKISYNDDKENIHAMAEESKLLRRKADSPVRSQSPIRMDPLSMARLYDPAACAPFSQLPLEVRMMHEIRVTPQVSPTSRRAAPMTPPPLVGLQPFLDRVTPASRRSQFVSPPLLAGTPPTRDLGRTHIRRGQLASRSDSADDGRSVRAEMASPPAAVITPPVATPQKSVKQGKQPLAALMLPESSIDNMNQWPKPGKVGCLLETSSSPTKDKRDPVVMKHAVCYSCLEKGRMRSNVIDQNGEPVCMDCTTFKRFTQLHQLTERPVKPRDRCDSLISEAHGQTENECQIEIQKTLSQFEANKEEKVEEDENRWFKWQLEHIKHSATHDDRRQSPVAKHLDKNRATPERRTHNPVAGPSQELRPEPRRQTTKEWQAEIQKNFREFEDKKEGGHEEEDKLDVTMHDVADSDEELSSSSLLDS